MMLRRDHWQRINRRLDPVRDAHRIGLNVSAHEFPWDTIQALSFALFRTYAVPSIGELLDRTGEFTGRVQKRYDDTTLLLEEVQRHGLDSVPGRDAVRRINQMHASYDISNDDMRYVLATFVVVPARWLERFGYRSLEPVEIEAATHYYRELGRHMAIKDLPVDYAGFARLLDDYEAERFAFSAGGRRVADSTLDLMTTFAPHKYLPARVARRLAYALMDEPLLDAFDYPRPSRGERMLVEGGMRLRATMIAHLPARKRPKFASDFSFVRSYPDGYAIATLGTFPRPAAGCPVHRMQRDPDAIHDTDDTAPARAGS